MTEGMEYKLIPVSSDDAYGKAGQIEPAYERIEDEFNDWLMYRKLYREHGEQERHKIASHQEFMHLVMAMEDFVECISKHNPDAIEIQEWNSAVEHFKLR